jgi:D-aminopeptidase
MSQQPRRARELGIVVGTLPSGPVDAITDVPGVLVGHTTLAEQHTGVTAIVPEALNVRRTLPAAIFVGNGHGKLVGSTQMDEFGVLETPIVLTSTLSVFRAADAVVSYMLSRHPDLRTINPLVGETNDGFLSDIRSRPITEEHVISAIEGATGGLPAEGCVGAGTGTVALGFKAGIGTSSRVCGEFTVGALAQSNFSGTLTVLGVPMPVGELPEPPGNSCMIVVATDAPLDARRLGRLAHRAIFAMTRVGSNFSNASGDYAIAFSTASPDRPLLGDEKLNPLFTGVMDAVEEALLNSLLMATTVTGHHGHRRHAVPHDLLLTRLGLPHP